MGRFEPPTNRLQGGCFANASPTVHISNTNTATAKGKALLWRNRLQNGEISGSRFSASLPPFDRRFQKAACASRVYPAPCGGFLGVRLESAQRSLQPSDGCSSGLVVFDRLTVGCSDLLEEGVGQLSRTDSRSPRQVTPQVAPDHASVE